MHNALLTVVLADNRHGTGLIKISTIKSPIYLQTAVKPSVAREHAREAKWKPPGWPLKAKFEEPPRRGERHLCDARRPPLGHVGFTPHARALHKRPAACKLGFWNLETRGSSFSSSFSSRDFGTHPALPVCLS